MKTDSTDEPKKLYPAQQPKVRKFRRLNPRERTFVKEYLRTGSSRKAGMIAYGGTMKPQSASTYGTQVLTRPKIQEVIDMYIKDEQVAVVLKEQLGATKMEKNFETGDTMEVPDNSARLKAVDISLKVKGAYPTGNTFSADKQINFIVTKMESNERTDINNE